MRPAGDQGRPRGSVRVRDSERHQHLSMRLTRDLRLHLPRVIGTLGVFLLFLNVPAAVAQSTSGAALMTGCLDTLSTSAFTRVPVYLEAKALDSTSRAILPGADSLAVRVAALIRLSLSDSTTSLPEGEGVLRWRQIGAPLRIAAHRDGRFTWSIPPRRSDGDTLRAPSRLLLEQALTTIRDAGTRIGWPADLSGDSLMFDLVYRWPDVAPDGSLQPLSVREAVPVFSMAMPWSKPVVVRYQQPVTYPYRERLAEVEGTVIVKFVVDTTGRASMNTFEDSWPTGRPKPTGALAEYYRSFLNSVRWSLSAARFEPARLGGCVVPQLVQQEFSFSLTR